MWSGWNFSWMSSRKRVNPNGAEVFSPAALVSGLLMNAK
jgi:hypothetical protein